MTRLKKNIGIILSMFMLTTAIPFQARAEGAPVTEAQPAAQVSQEVRPASADTKAPVLVGITRDKASASAADTVTYRVTMTEVNPEAVYLTLKNDTGTFRQDISSQTFIQDGDKAIFTLQWIIPETIESSNVSIAYYGLHDTAGNAALVNVSPTSQLAANTRVKVTNDTGNTDITPPRLISLYPTATVAAPGETVHFTVRLKDANPGLVKLTIRNEAGTYSNTLENDKYAHNGDEAIYNLAWRVPDTIATGVVYVDFYSLNDTAGNEIQEILNPRDPVAVTSRVNVTNQTGNTDIDAPKVVDIKVSQSEAYPGQRVQYEFKVKEANPDRLYVGLRQVKGTYYRNFALSDFTRDGEYAIYRFYWDIPSDIGSGNVYVHYYAAYDTAGNSNIADLSQNDPLALGSRVGINLDPVTLRIQGSNRYDTAARISQAVAGSSTTVVLASGENYPDALTGIAYAEELGAPMLLTRGQSLSDATRDEIQRLKATKVVILGGPVAVSEGVEAALKSMGLSVTRLQGSNRYETAVNIGEAMTRAGSHLFLTSGMEFADAISIAPVSALKDQPVLLTQPGRLPEPTRQAILRWGIRDVTILGGEIAVNEAIASELTKLGVRVERISGSNRYDTNARINQKYYTSPTQVVMASGALFPDALTGSLLALKNSAAMVLTREDRLVPAVSDYLMQNPVRKAVILGGPIAVSEAVQGEVEQIILTR